MSVAYSQLMASHRGAADQAGHFRGGKKNWLAAARFRAASPS